MDIAKALNRDHKMISVLFKQLESYCGETKSAGLKELYLKLHETLSCHAKAEERVVYKRLFTVKKQDVEFMTHESAIEHELVDKLLTELKRSVQPKNPLKWFSKLKVLREMVEHHVQEEEKYIFKYVKKNFSRLERSEMTEEFVKIKEELKTSRKLTPAYQNRRPRNQETGVAAH
ncbi:MAG: hemerythrin domain-containing protein [Oligoflexia bacterium]|nr:hemerythrin domain-containing protein [Oligoflexia bacterium]